LTTFPGNITFFCEGFSEEKRCPRGVVGVNGSDVLDDLEGSDGLTGKGIDDGLLRSRGGGVGDEALDWDSGIFEEDWELRGGEVTELGWGAVRCEYGIGGAVWWRLSR
jgi:hypothetical protein